jgi:hypothetical protein
VVCACGGRVVTDPTDITDVDLEALAMQRFLSLQVSDS